MEEAARQNDVGIAQPEESAESTNISAETREEIKAERIRIDKASQSDLSRGLCNFVGDLLHQAIQAYASIMCVLILSVGLSFFFHTIQGAAFMHSTTSKEFLSSLKTAASMLFGNFAIPFSETVATAIAQNAESPEASLSQAMSVGVWSFWMPCMVGTVLFLYGISGYLTLKFRHIAFLLPFTGLAVVLLVWQVEVSQMLTQIAYEEKFEFTASQTHLKPSQMMHYEMFKTTYEKFIEVLSTAQCEVSSTTSSQRPIQLDCERNSMESNLLRVAVVQFCVPRSRPELFKKRVEVCKLQGSTLSILPKKPLVREEAFCRCRLMVYDWMQAVSRWSMVVWTLQLFGVCAVVYFGMEANLAKMGTKERREILGFAAVGIAVLACRVAFFDGTLATMHRELEAAGS